MRGIQQRSIWAFLLLLASPAAFAVPTYTEGYQRSEALYVSRGVPFPSSYLRHPQPLEEEMNLEKFQRLLKDQNLTKIEDVIPLLPWQMTNDNYVVMYRSRSLQAATPASPRIISYTPTARFILTFNGGDPGTRGHNTIEVVQFRDQDQRYEFREFVFDGKSVPEASEANPRKCQACHQDRNRTDVDLRPNWEPYNIWPGAIGSDSGRISSPLLQRYDFAKLRMLPQDLTFLVEQADEAAILDRFLKSAPDHPRYRALNALNVHAPTDLTDILAVSNFQRVLRLAQQDADIYRNHQELLALIARCGYSSEITEILKPYNNGLLAPYSSYRPRSLSQNLLTLYGGLGVNTNDWPMDFGTRGRFAFYEIFGTPSDPQTSFLYAWKTVVTNAAELLVPECETLAATAAEKSRAYLARPDVQARLASLRAGPQITGEMVVTRCARCHGADNGLAPEIPFLDPVALRAAFSRPARSGRSLREEIQYRTSDMATLGEQMPPTERLSPGEHRALLNYLDR